MFPEDLGPPGPLPLAGLTVLDCTVFQQGPYTGVLLADFGADVIKVEGPDSPDPGRGLFTGLGPGDFNAYFESHNRNKRSIVIDLKSEAGREVLLRLSERADVFLQNMRAGVIEKLGLGYDDVRARNPHIIYASGSGFGRKGPQRHWAAMDPLGQARGGTMLSQGGPGDPPLSSFGGMADQTGALCLAYGIMLALWHRERTGEGQQVEASLLGGQIALQSFNITTALGTGRAPKRRRREDSEALFTVYRCRDDAWLALGMSQTDRFWPLFLRTIEREELRDDPRFHTHATRIANRRDLVGVLDEVFAARDQADWVATLGAAGIPVAPVQDYLQLLDDPQVGPNGYIQEIAHPREGPVRVVGPAVQLEATPGSIRRVAPDFGQHTEEVLLEHGFTWDEIGALGACGAIGGR